MRIRPGWAVSTAVLIGGTYLGLVGSTSSVSAATAAPVPPFTACPAVGASPSCSIFLVVNSDRTVSVYGDPAVGPYDGGDDTLVGIRNDSSVGVDAVTVTGPGTNLAGLDGDGLCTYGISGCPFGPTGYEGPGTSIFTLPELPDSAEIDFTGSLAPTASAYFSLEGALTEAQLTSRPGGLRKAYVALGDSYSSGEGAGAGNYFQWYETFYRCTLPRTGVVSERVKNPIPGWACTPYTVGHDIGCHRAPTAWSFALARESDEINDTVENAACSGATIKKNLLEQWKDNEQPQVDRLRDLNKANPVDLVTFTISGNDVGFKGIARTCFLANCAGIDKEVQKQLATLDLVDPIRKLSVAASHATIAYVSYPQVVPDSDAETVNCGWLTPAERVALRSVVGDINLAEYNAVAEAKREGIDAVFVDITDALKGHELCSSDSHVVRIYGNPVNSEQGHPDSVDRSASGGTSGQEDLANAVYSKLIELGVIGS